MFLFSIRVSAYPAQLFLLQVEARNQRRVTEITKRIRFVGSKV
jgi:hypothetical protein